MKTRFHFPIAALLGLAILGSGCSAYQLGTAGNPDIDSVHIGLIQNETDAPQAVVPLTHALHEALVSDGRVRPAPYSADADADLSVTLTRYERFVGAVQSRDTALGESFRTVLTGQASLIRSDGSVIFQDRPFRVESSVLIREDLVQAENQNMPVITRALAEKIVRAVVNTW